MSRNKLRPIALEAQKHPRKSKKGRRRRIALTKLISRAFLLWRMIDKYEDVKEAIAWVMEQLLSE